MNKISSWKLEVIHFSAEDIIVTSGANPAPYVFEGGRHYFTIGREINNAWPKSTGYPQLFFTFSPKESTDTFVFDSGNRANNVGNLDGYRYSWFNDNSWHTINETSDYYKDSSTGEYIWTD